MKHIYFLFTTLLLISCNNSTTRDDNFETQFERSNGMETATYYEVIDYWKALAANYSEIDLQEVGMTDAGYPLHLVTLTPGSTFDFEN